MDTCTCISLNLGPLHLGLGYKNIPAADQEALLTYNPQTLESLFCRNNEFTRNSLTKSSFSSDVEARNCFRNDSVSECVHLHNPTMENENMTQDLKTYLTPPGQPMASELQPAMEEALGCNHESCMVCFPHSDLSPACKVVGSALTRVLICLRPFLQGEVASSMIFSLARSLTKNFSACSVDGATLVMQVSRRSLWISSLGRVQNSRGWISWGFADGEGGYRRYVAAQDGRKLRVYVHRLVAFAYHGPPPTTSHVVNHLDGNRANNTMKNLEYATPSQNSQHSFSVLRNLRGKAVEARLLHTEDWRAYKSISEATALLGVSRASIRRCCKGEISSWQGYEFCWQHDVDMPGEVWVQARCPRTLLPLPLVRVSSLGRFQGPSGQKSYGSLASAGYRRVRYKDSEILLHRMLVCSFGEHPPVGTKWQVNHKDGNRQNNHLNNLEIVTPSENVLHAWAMRKDRAAHGARQPVKGRPSGAELWSTFSSVTEAATYARVSTSEVCRCCKRRQRSAGGWEWQYALPVEPKKLPDEQWRYINLSHYSEAWKAAKPANLHVS